MSARRVFTAGCSANLRDQIAVALGADLEDERGAEPAAGDVVFLASDSADLPRGNAFSACREIKARDTAVAVFVVIRDDDSVSEPIARFCLADGCVEIDEVGNLCEPDALSELVDPARRAVPVDALLKRFGGRLHDSVGGTSTLLKLAEQHTEHAWMDTLTDDDTGLFDGPFATFKLDEEFKRATRFHQPLSLILLDCGAALPQDALDRRTVLAEMASIFLNECRDIDTLARFTETVFLFLLPGTGSDGAASVARRMLEELGQRTYSAAIEVTPAAGIVTVPTTGISDRQEFLGRAEACLEVAMSDPSHSGLCAL